MTKWKKELHRKGYEFESDLPMVPFNGIQGIYPGIFKDGIYITTVHASIVWTDIFYRDGSKETVDDIMLRR